MNPIIYESDHNISIIIPLGLFLPCHLRRAQKPPEQSTSSSSASAAVSDPFLVLESMPFGDDNRDTLLLPQADMDHAALDLSRTASPIQIPSAPTVP